MTTYTPAGRPVIVPPRLLTATPDNVMELADDEVFVFGSNLSGRHGKGAALVAYRLFGARRGIGAGPTGRCYAIPTKDERMRPCTLPSIERSVRAFLRYATRTPHQRFLVTPIGCGLAGNTPREIAPMFDHHPANVVLPQCFLDVLQLKVNGQ